MSQRALHKCFATTLLLSVCWLGCQTPEQPRQVKSEATEKTPSNLPSKAVKKANKKSNPQATSQSGSEPAKVREIIFGVVPQQAPSQIIRNWSPFAREMSKRTGWKWTVKTAPSIPEFERRCLAGRYDVAYMNPYHYTVFAQKPGYKAFARQKDKKIRGILVVRKDSPINALTELADKRAAFPSPAAFAASVVTRTYLRNEGIKVDVSYANSHDSVYTNVAQGIQDVGGGVLRTWKATNVKVRAQLRILWTSPKYTPHAFAYHPRLDESEIKKLSDAIKALDGAPRDAKVFDPIRFKGMTAAKDTDWDDVRALKITELDHLLKSGSTTK